MALNPVQIVDLIGRAGEMGKKAYIPFSVWMVKDDAEKVRFTWGVKSLPWLILTDNKHIVRACGFSLGELDKNIQEVEERKQP